MKIQYKYLLLFAWMVVIFLLSNEVADTSSGRSDLIVNILTTSLNVSWSEQILTFLTRKAAHIIAYFILGVLVYVVMKTYKLSAKHVILLSIALTLAYAVSDEIHQLFVPGRSGELRDVLVDTIAGTAGIYLSYILHRKLASRKKGNNTV